MSSPATSGAPLGITLDGIHLSGISPENYRLRAEEMVTHRQAVDATGRESRPWTPPATASKLIKYRLNLDYRHVRDKADLIDRLLAVPGSHRIIVWKYVTVTFSGNGATRVFTLPRALARDAVDHAGAALSPPAGRQWTDFAPEVRTGPLSAGLTVSRVTQATWDAGDPPAGTVWFLEASRQLQLAPDDTPATDSWLYVATVPELSVHQISSDDRNHDNPIREPRRLELREA